jgi:hypothetical protein
VYTKDKRTARAGHAHKAHKTKDYSFQHSVAVLGEPENRAAHGNITRELTCTCGAIRLININGRHVEEGPWAVDA